MNDTIGWAAFNGLMYGLIMFALFSLVNHDPMHYTNGSLAALFGFVYALGYHSGANRD